MNYERHRARAAFRACALRSSSVRAIRALVAFLALRALDAAFLGVVMRPRAAAAWLTVRSIAREHNRNHWQLTSGLALGSINIWLML